MQTTDSTTRQHVLQAALKKFADCGYEGASVQGIVEAANVTKPTLYYYFRNKKDLYQGLVDYAHDERLRLMQAAAERGQTVAEKLVEILAELFEFLQNNRELMRIAFATAFAAPGEVPAEVHYAEKCARNFEFVHDLIRRGQAAGELDCRLDRQTAERIVELFLAGAAANRSSEKAVT